MIGAVPPQIGRIHSDRVIPLLGRGFPTKRRIAEIAKNCNDEYFRLDSENTWKDIDGNTMIQDERMILIMFEGNNLVIIDSGGMSESDIDHWSGFGVPSEELTGEREQGIGAKASMRTLADNAAYLISSKNGVVNKVGFLKDEDTQNILTYPNWIHSSSCNCEGKAYMPDAAKDDPTWTGSNEFGSKLEGGEWEWFCEGDFRWNEEIDDVLLALKREAKECGIDLEVPWHGELDNGISNDVARKGFLEIIEKRGGWTMIHIDGVEIKAQIPSGRSRLRVINGIKRELKSEPQMRRTLEESYVFFVDGGLAHLLDVVEPDMLPGIAPLELEIEGPLVNPDTGHEVELEEPLTLCLKASDVSLTSDALKGLRGVRISDGRCNVWVHPIPSGQDPGAALHIWGHATVITKGDVLRDRADSGREIEPDCLEAKAINHAIDPYILEYQEQIANLLGSRTRQTHSSNELQDELDNLMNQLEDLVDMEALFDEGDDIGGQTPLASSATDLFIGNRMFPMASVSMVSDVTHRLNIVAMGPTPYGLASLEQLDGLRGAEREPYFTIESSDPSIVEVVGNFTIRASSTGSATITVSTSDKLNGDAVANLQIEVIEIETPPSVTLEPIPGPRGAPVDILISGQSKNGEVLNQKNTIFGITIEGPGSIKSRLPPVMRTGREIGSGRVCVKWSDEGTVEVDFSTTSEIHIPPPRGDDGDDGQKNRKFPRLVLCGQEPLTSIELEGLGLGDYALTVQPSPSLPTLYYDYAWHLDAGIVWLNPESQEAAAMLASSHNRRGLVTSESRVYHKWRWTQIAEVAVRQLMSEEVGRNLTPMPTSVNDIWSLQNRAKQRLGSLYRQLASGAFDEVGNND